MNTKALLTAALLIPFLPLSHAQAVEPRLNAPSFLPFHIAPQNGWSGFYGTELPTAHVSGFGREHFATYLTIATGPYNTNMYGTQGASFTGLLVNDECRVEGPINFGRTPFTQIHSLYQTRTQALHSCIRMRVHDVTGIKPAEPQVACNVETITPYEAIAKGGVCYFMIVPGAAFNITYELDPECSSQEKLASLNFAAHDITAFSGFYISGDASGHSSSLLPLGSTTLRLSTEASGKNFPLSTKMGEGVPLWPARYETEFHMGDVRINNAGEGRSAISTSILISNACEKTCTNGICESPCDYPTAVGSQVMLEELHTNGHVSLLDIWYTGTNAPAQWQGALSSSRYVNYPFFAPGKRFRITADLTYLTMFHQLYKEGFKQLLVDIGILRADPTKPTRPLPPIATLDTIKTLSQIPQVPQFPLLGDNGVTDYSLTLNALRSLIQLMGWPPYYTEACYGTKCVPATHGGAKTLVGVDFSIESIAPDGSAQLSKMELWRKSTFLPSYHIETDTLPKVRCR
jgi:hypothetical protein